MPSSIVSPFPVFNDLDGTPLENGYIYIGTSNLNPETSPVNVFWDAARTIPAAQPIRTIGGFPSRGGTPSNVYVEADTYSITVRNSRRVFVYSAFDQTDAPSSVFDISTQVITATAGQSTFTLTTFTYLPGTDTLQVYRNGLRLTAGTDYLETNSSTVTLTAAAAAGDEFLFQGGAVITGNQTPGTSVSFIQAGTGAITRNMQDKARESVSVLDFGAVGDGTVDDTGAFNNALTSLSAKGGLLYIPAGKYRIVSSNITVPANVSVVGDSFSSGGQKQTGFDVGSRGSVIYINGTHSIVMSESTALIGLIIINDALRNALPFQDATTATNAVAAYSGTAISAAGSDIQISNVSVYGFNQAYSSFSFSRTKIDWFNFDCTNGILIDTSRDVARITNCHGQPFLTTNRSWTTSALLNRSGTAYSMQKYFDTGMLVNCFEYGWNVGFDCQSAIAIELLNCISDGNAQTGEDSSQIGFKFGSSNETGKNILARLIGCSVSGRNKGVYINGTVRLQISDCNFWGNASHVYSDQHDTLSLYGNQFDYLNGNWTFRSGIVLETTVTGSTVAIGNTFSFIQNCWSVSPSAKSQATIVRNAYTSNTVNNFQEQVVYSTPAMSALNDYFYASTTGITKRAYQARGTPTSPAVLVNNDPIWQFGANGYDGASFQQAGGFRFQVQGSPATGSMPAAVLFSTNNGSGQADRFAIHSTGYIYPISDNAYSCGNSSNRWTAVWAANGTIQTSDENSKTEIIPSSLGLEFINALKPVSYKFKIGSNKPVKQIYRDADGNECSSNAEGAIAGEIITEPIAGKRTHWGLLAQQVKSVIPDGIDFGGWVQTDLNDPNSEQGLRYEEFISPLIKAVQELSAEVTSLKSKLL